MLSAELFYQFGNATQFALIVVLVKGSAQAVGEFFHFKPQSNFAVDLQAGWPV